MNGDSESYWPLRLVSSPPAAARVPHCLPPSPKSRTNVSALFAARLEMGTGGNAAAVRVPPSVAAA